MGLRALGTAGIGPETALARVRPGAVTEASRFCPSLAMLTMDPLPTATLSARDAIAALCVMAAQVDGMRPEEHARLAEVFETLGDVDSARLFENVIFGHVAVNDAVAALTNPAMRADAFEMAAGVCDADGHTSNAERAWTSSSVRSGSTTPKRWR